MMEARSGLAVLGEAGRGTRFLGDLVRHRISEVGRVIDDHWHFRNLRGEFARLVGPPWCGYHPRSWV